VASHAPAPPTGGNGGSLPTTGSDQQMILLLGGLTLVSAGLLMVALTRRPRNI
jgi:LPXTG-motif cell wall-anchored protein